MASHPRCSGSPHRAPCPAPPARQCCVTHRVLSIGMTEPILHHAHVLPMVGHIDFGREHRIKATNETPATAAPPGAKASLRWGERRVAARPFPRKFPKTV